MVVAVVVMNMLVVAVLVGVLGHKRAKKKVLTSSFDRLGNGRLVSRHDDL